MVKITAGILGAGVTLLVASDGSADASFMDRTAATAKVVSILHGAPYGETASDVEANLTDVRLVSDGVDQCSERPRASPVWSFDVRTKPTPSNPGNVAYEVAQA